MRHHRHERHSQREYSFAVGDRRRKVGIEPRRSGNTLRDAGLNLLDAAIEHLMQHQDDRAVHAARKAAKRLRALLRLMRRCLGPIAYRRQNRRVRDAAKPLTAVRDAFILRKSLQTMPERPAALRRGLDAEYRQERTALESRGARAAVAKFRSTREWLAGFTASDSEIESAIAGLKKSYKAGRRAFARAKSQGDQSLHEWRKQAQYFLNQLELVHSVFSVEFVKLHRRADQIAEILGTDHDLGLLSSKLRRYGRNNRALARRIKKQRHKLQARALQLGKKLYRRPAKRIEAVLTTALRSL